ncbi:MULTISPECIES: DUF2390 domain-containing protein [Thioalkalivibrio]|uniref:DUF2390 domain-containing protein n=1 Tax=Thioalkalivibrio TaxID=106633 RepID=UPI00035F84CD|nr:MULTISPECIES: DUF2390 domain-containing protein [Thioalkalivibrio]OOC49314.1 hypothetical protein B0684_05850 [Thioalkalivibrio versutus]
MPEPGPKPEPGEDPLATDFAPFWAFAASLWADPVARERLMRWQDDFGVDVMLALFALWYPQPLSTPQWRALRETARRWQASSTERLRVLRRQLHTPERDTLYRAVLALELQSERLGGLQLLAEARRQAEQSTGANAIDPQRRLRTLFPDLPDAEIRDGVRAFAAA